MRISIAALCCAVGFAVSGGPGTPADDKADIEKEARKFQGTWTFESSETGGNELPTGELKGLLLTFEGDKHTRQEGGRGDPSRHTETRPFQVTEDHRCDNGRGPAQGDGHAGHLRDRRGHAESLLRPRRQDAADGVQKPARFEELRQRPQAQSSSESVTPCVPKSSNPCARRFGPNLARSRLGFRDFVAHCGGGRCSAASLRRRASVGSTESASVGEPSTAAWSEVRSVTSEAPLRTELALWVFPRKRVGPNTD